MADINPNWYNIFPHTCFSIANLDWLISKYGEQDDAIKKIQASDDEQNVKLEDHEARITTAEGDIDAVEGRCSDLESRMTTAEGDIDAVEGRCSDLESRMTTAEGDIDAVEGRCSDLETTVNGEGGLSQRMSTAEGNISDLQTAVGGVSGDITSLSNRIQSNTNAITGLDGRVTTLEGHSVVANPGGTGSALNTVAIDGTTYQIVGSGQGGSSVTPNPAGQATADLTKVDIDGTVYAIPSGVDTSDLIAEAYDPTDIYDTGDIVIYNGALYRAIDDSVTGAFDSDKWVETTCAEECQNANDTAVAVNNRINNIESSYTRDQRSIQMNTNVAEVTTNFTLTSGRWLVKLRGDFDTSNCGSTARGCDIWIKDSSNNTYSTNQFYLWGSELSAYTLDTAVETLAIIEVPSNSTLSIHGQFEVKCSRTYSVDVDYDVQIVRLI